MSLIYLWATPPLEASDELWHFGLVTHIADTGDLPVQAAGTITPWRQEGSQPPLYYWIAAALVRPVDRGDFDAVRQPNPHAIAGVPGAVGNKNLVLHASPHPVPQRTALAVYILRLFGIVCGGVTVAAVYASARTLRPDQPAVALLAAALTAFNPMFLFISASVNNDPLVIALSSLVIWQMLILLRDGFDTRRSLLIALLIAAAALTKLSGLVLVPVIALVALWTAYRRHDWRGLILLGGALAISWALLDGWWYLRNLSLYGELFGTATMAAVAGTRAGGFTLSTLLSEFQGFRFTYWGVFGAVNIMTFRWFYDAADAVTLLALIGLALHLLRRREAQDRGRVLLLGLLVLIGAVSVIAWTSQTYASQGRLLFPYLAAISPLLAVGLIELVTLITRRIWPIASGAGISLAIFALIVPFASIAPAYAPPPILTALPSAARPVYARFGHLALIGYQTPDARYQPGDVVPVTVYWQVDQADSADLSLYLHAVVNGDQVVGRVDSYPGGGRLRTSTWTPGAIYADHYALQLDDQASGDPSLLRLQVGWWNYPSGELVPAADQQGEPLSSVMLDGGAFAAASVDQTVAGDQPAAADFSGLIRLQGYQLNGDLLALVWAVIAPPPEDYTVFVQVLDSAGNIAGQGDAAPPMPTHYWRAGEHFVTRHAITYTQSVVSGDQVVIGWYRPSDFSRLTTDAPNSAYPLTTIAR